MTIKEFLQWVIEHKDYAPLYSSLVATGAFLFSILSFIISNIVSKNRAKSDKIISDARYEEQRKQYEERLDEERRRRKEDKREAEEKLRLSEKPRFVFKNSKVVSNSHSENILLRMEFINKGMDIALAAGARYQLAKITLVHKERLMKYMKHFTRVPKGTEKILDLACGFGRHSLEFARRGYDVTGIDITPAYIDYANEQAKKENLNAKFIC